MACSVQYRPKKSERTSFSKAQFNVESLFFNFQDFILCVELIVLQSSFIRIKNKMHKYFFLIKKETMVFGFFWTILYMPVELNICRLLFLSLTNDLNTGLPCRTGVLYHQTNWIVNFTIGMRNGKIQRKMTAPAGHLKQNQN